MSDHTRGPCGCRVQVSFTEDRSDFVASILYCPTHREAETYRDALIAIQSGDAHDQPYCGMDGCSCNELYAAKVLGLEDMGVPQDEARAAIAKTEGDKDAE